MEFHTHEDKIIQYFECLEECFGDDCRRVCKTVFTNEDVTVDKESTDS